MVTSHRKCQFIRVCIKGGCASAVYFLVIAEILAISLRNNDEVEGITWRNILNLLNQFADDMDIFSTNKEQSLRAILEELDKFRQQLCWGTRKCPPPTILLYQGAGTVATG